VIIESERIFRIMDALVTTPIAVGKRALRRR
jgi:hypothetical protein